MTDAGTQIHAPLGVKGSGRVRYGAAMALWRDGLISAEVLEVYRIASAHDTRDPLADLASRGLPMPPPTLIPSPLRQLYHAARNYLLTLDHPGAAEVRAGLPADPGPPRPVPPRPNSVIDRWLAPALVPLTATHPDLAAAIAAAAPLLEWITYDSYPRDQIGEAFATGHAYASIFGGDAPLAATDFDLGLFLIAPAVLYRDHHHAAPELYAPLTGPHGWRFGPDRPLIIKPAHQPVWNPPHQPHLTKVGAVPFLCLFVWTGDVDQIAQVIPANDWPELEALRLD
jgi:Dimethlysulfonioproprionate lyase